MQTFSYWSRQIKKASKLKCKETEYRVHNDADVAHKDVKIFFNTNHFPSFPFCVPHTKPHSVRGLSNNYHIPFDPKLGHGI